MPRVNIKKSDYMVKDFEKWINIELCKRDMTQSDLANKLNITQSALSKKLKNGNFGLKEIVEIVIAFEKVEEFKSLTT